jgi:hypothetical protein
LARNSPLANSTQPIAMDHRGPITAVHRPASSDEMIISAVIGRNTTASRYPEAPTTSTRYSAVKKKIANVAK